MVGTREVPILEWAGEAWKEGGEGGTGPGVVVVTGENGGWAGEVET